MSESHVKEQCVDLQDMYLHLNIAIIVDGSNVCTIEGYNRRLVSTLATLATFATDCHTFVILG